MTKLIGYLTLSDTTVTCTLTPVLLCGHAQPYLAVYWSRSKTRQARCNSSDAALVTVIRAVPKVTKRDTSSCVGPLGVVREEHGLSII